MSLTDLPSGSGIYLIENKVDDLVYVGQSLSMNQRVKKHILELESKKHWNKRLQEDWGRLGLSGFEISLVEEVEPIAELLDRREDYWIGHYQSLNPEFGYNLRINGAAGETTAFPCETIQIGDYTAVRRLTDGYWCVTSLCDQLGKRADNWIRLPDVKENMDLIEMPSENPDKGIWCHPDLVLSLAIWLHPKFYFGYMHYLRSELKKID